MQGDLHNNTLAGDVRRLSGQAVAGCYQCGRCTAGCPMAGHMDLAPHRLMRLVQAGGERAARQALASGAIWCCVGCLTCTQRCPRQLDPAAVMDALRELSSARRLASPRQRRVLAFNRAFLTTIRKNGRINEFSLVRRYKLASRDLFSDLLIAPAMLRRGKLPLRGHRIRGRDEIARIFHRTQARPASARPDDAPAPPDQAGGSEVAS